MFECGVDSDQLNLMYKCDAYSKVAVKTPVGLTSRVDLLKIIPQGSTMSPLKCSVTVDQIAQEHEQNVTDHLYQYRGSRTKCHRSSISVQRISAHW